LRQNAIIKGIAPFLTHQCATLITLALAVLIGFLTLTPVTELPTTLPFNDKVYHLSAFTVLAIPLTTVNPRYALWIVPVIISYGGIIELVQPFVNREANWGDFWFNTMGTFLGTLIGCIGHWLFYRILRTSKQ